MRHKCLVAAALATFCPAPIFAQSVKAGIDAWQKTDYPAAVNIWRPLAEGGDVDAAFNLGQAYRLGRGVPINLAAAQTWLERAARKGHIDAQTTLGLMLFQNGNQVAGLRWLGQAAERGDARAMLVYGTALFNGDSLPRDPVLGYAYVSRAAAQGLAPAKTTLAELDQILPLDERKKAVTLAIAKAKATPPPAAKSKPVRAASTKSKPQQTASTATATAMAGAAPSSGPWRIQLGAFSKRSSAEALFRRVSSNSELYGKLPFYVPVGAVTRLQVGPFESKAAADRACKAIAQACFPVAAKS